MRLGMCVGTDVERMRVAAQVGYDYVEGGLSAIAAMGDEEFETFLRAVKELPIPMLKCNGFMPGSVHPTGANVSEAELRAYLEKAMFRAQRLGIRVCVFGSGAARQVPPDFSHVEAWKQLAAFLRLMAEYCEKYDLKIAIEPLRRKECNIVNLVSEATVLAAWADSPRIGVLGDTFHMLSCHEPWDALTYAGDRLYHMHISHPLADMSSRNFPAPNDGTDYRPIFETLKAMHYAGDVSVEAGCGDFAADAARALACLRALV